jgi:hypothetical protein
MTERRSLAGTEVAAMVGLLTLTWAFLLYYFRPSLLWLDTMVAGGDTPSFLQPVHHLRDVLLPAWIPQGWNLGNFGGYAPYQFYFLPPSLIILAFSTVIPLNVAFKLVTVAGTFFLPLATMLTLRRLGYTPAVSALGSVASLLFLFNEGNTMWGGNIPSTLAGEFAHSLGFGFAVLFVGLLYRGIEEERGWRSCAVVLAFAGLCHPIAFLNGVTPGLFFLFDRKHFVRNLRYLTLVYGGAVLLMAFWLVPLIAKLGYATSINWKWYFQSWREILPPILWPVAVCAAADVAWMAARPRSEDRPARYLLFGVVGTLVSFLNATAVGLPEIRFLPFAYFLAVLLACDLAARLLPAARMPLLTSSAVAVGVLAWVYVWTSFIPFWIRGNYEGIERRSSYALLRSIADAVRGTIGDPRIAYENSPAHDRFGSMRIFESLPLLSGRATLEGVLLQTGVTSPFIYWLQSQISKQGTGVIPGYSYPSLDLERATARLKLFNVSDMITVTPEVTAALDRDQRWERIFSSPPYAVFHLKEGDRHYVRVPRYRPVLVQTDSWKKDFHRWFATDAALDVPIVAADHVPPTERARFPLVGRSPLELPREPMRADCQVDEQVDHLAIEFTTTCPGLPHLIAISYYPNWVGEGVSHVFLASPAFMLVFPDGPHVRLTFRRIAVDRLGIILSLLGLGLCFIPARRLLATTEPAGVTARALSAARPYLMKGGVAVVLAATAWNTTHELGPSYYYERGWKAFEKKDYTLARRNFERAILLGGASNTAADATFFRAASLLRAGNPAAALVGYQEVIDRFSDSTWVAESHYHVGLSLRALGRVNEAKERFRYVITTYPRNRWACFADEQIRELNGESRREVPCV